MLYERSRKTWILDEYSEKDWVCRENIKFMLSSALRTSGSQALKVDLEKPSICDGFGVGGMRARLSTCIVRRGEWSDMGLLGKGLTEGEP